MGALTRGSFKGFTLAEVLVVLAVLVLLVGFVLPRLDRIVGRARTPEAAALLEAALRAAGREAARRNETVVLRIERDRIVVEGETEPILVRELPEGTEAEPAALAVAPDGLPPEAVLSLRRSGALREARRYRLDPFTGRLTPLAETGPIGGTLR